MKKVKSHDGTLIAFEKTGKGPPMVLVHGSITDHTQWHRTLPVLEKYCTVYAVDRRGRGESGDAAYYRADLEAEDVAAVVDMIDEPVILLGHSYGGFISLEAALRTKNLSKLILYEPTMFLNGSNEQDDSLIKAIIKIESILQEGDKEEALIFVLENLLALSEDEIELLRSTNWSKMVNATSSLPRELKAVKEYELKTEKFKGLTVPTMVLSGSESLLRQKKPAEMLVETLPKSMLVKLEGQTHHAILNAPELFADKVLKFARE